VNRRARLGEHSTPYPPSLLAEEAREWVDQQDEGDGSRKSST
jgi:hypothetical protein